MPRIFSFNDFKSQTPKVLAYADKHAPLILCAPVATRGQAFSVKVRIGTNQKHPNTADHHFCYIQLWDLERLAAVYSFDHRTFGDNPLQIEATFTLIPQRSLRLTAMAYCNKHGLWQSEEVFVHAPETDLVVN